MNNMPKKLRDRLADDPFYQQCCVTGLRGTWDDPLEWHHNLIVASNQVQERFAILPILKSVHDQARNHEMRECLDWIMLNRATDDELLAISKAIDYFHRRAFLNRIFGEYPGEMVSISCAKAVGGAGINYGPAAVSGR